jgi:pyruvate-ferredoxin/flavodoxin oxidoreductase
MANGLEAQKDAVNSGHFPLYRFNPDLEKQGQNPLKLDSKAPTMAFRDAALKENRFKQLQKTDKETSDAMLEKADELFKRKFKMLETLANLPQA